MIVQTISSIRFGKSRKGNWRGEITVTLPSGVAYPRLTGEAMGMLLATVKAANGEISGETRTVQLKDGGQATLVEYRTPPVRFTVELLGGYADNPTNIQMVRLADPAMVEALVAGVAAPLRSATSSTSVQAIADLG